VGIRFDARERDGFAQFLGGFSIQLGEAQVQPAERGIGNESVDKIARIFFFGAAGPVLGTV